MIFYPPNFTRVFQMNHSCSIFLSINLPINFTVKKKKHTVILIFESYEREQRFFSMLLFTEVMNTLNFFINKLVGVRFKKIVGRLVTSFSNICNNSKLLDEEIKNKLSCKVENCSLKF